MGGILPSAGSVAMGVAARGALMGVETGTRAEGGWRELVRCGFVAGGCVIGVVVFERDFFLGFVPKGLVGRIPVLRRFMRER